MQKNLYTSFLVIILLSISSQAHAAETQTTTGVLNDNSNLTLTVDQYFETIPNTLLDKWVSHQTAYALSPNIRTEFENTANYCPVNKFFCELTITKTHRRNITLSSQAKIETQEINSYLEDLARKVNRDPAEAKFKAEAGKVITFAQSTDGIKLDTKKSLEQITETLKSSNLKSEQKISLAYDSQKAATTYGDTNNLGISSLIGQGTSNFKGSPKNRIFNIKVATERFNGILIKPGEEFSFVKILGEVDGEHGYLPELVIKNNVTEPEFGGGVCQVSTTAFRAAIYSGLKITARRNHAYPVSYYNPQGMDSTVYVPNPDLRFINNTPNHILIQTKIVGTVLTFEFYGTDDGRKTTVDGPYITEKQPDGALKAHFSQKVVDSSGKEFINDVFNSSYGSPYKYPHPGGPTLSAKPANWSDEEWKNYKKTLKDMTKAAANPKQ